MRKVHLIFLIISAFVVASIFLTPLFTYIAPDAAEVSYKTHALNCHQRPERSPHLFGHQLPECWRCTAIFVGSLVGIILIIRLGASAKWWWLALATIPIALDGGTQMLGWRTSTNQLRLVTGGIFGMVSALWFVPFATRVLDWCGLQWRKLKKRLGRPGL
jgi:uncharacterized membrane protein